MIFRRITIYFVLLLISCQCIPKSYFQEDARLKPDSTNKLSPAPEGHVWAVIAPQYRKSKVHEWIWGRHYRQVWATPVLVKVLDIRKLPGSLQPKELGGGLQTTSLTLKARNGRLFTLRTLDKDPSKALPPVLRKTFVATIMRDQTSAGNPYAAFTLPPLAKATGIFHTKPQMYYVPLQDNGLGPYSKHFAGKVVMVEEKFKDLESLIPVFGEAADVVDTREMLQNRFKSNRYRVDQLEFARARLFDVLIGDWDRHEGQWNWLEYPNPLTGQVTYKPLPKDRDQTYYRFDDGLIPWLLSRKVPARKIKPLRHNVPDVGGLSYNARFLDQRFLNEVSAGQWAQLAAQMKAALTDEVLTQSLALFPDTIYHLEGRQTLAWLKERVNQLPATATALYKLLAREVTIAATDDKEMFLVKRIDDFTTSVEVQTLPGKNKGKPRQLYYRVFNHQDTKKLTLHGLGEDDEFMVEGSVGQGIRINIYGGLGADKITDKSQVRKGAAKTFVFDTSRGNDLDLGENARNKTKPKVTVHAYDREGF